MQSHGITLSFHREMADSSGELVGPDVSAAVTLESYPRFIKRGFQLREVNKPSPADFSHYCPTTSMRWPKLRRQSAWETGVGNRRCISWPLSGPSEAPCRTAAIDRSCTTCAARGRSGSSVTADKPVRVTIADRLRVQRGRDGSHPRPGHDVFASLSRGADTRLDLDVEDIHVTGDANANRPTPLPSIDADLRRVETWLAHSCAQMTS
jgi:hypothetical protein